MTRIAALATIALLSVPALARADVSVLDNHQTMTIDCAKDSSAAILGNDNTITLSGTCSQLTIDGNHNTVHAASVARVSVAGNHNTVAITAADEISIPGNNNTVAWTKGVHGATPKLSNTGKGNSVSQTK